MKTDSRHDPRIAVIGGGTGLSTMLRGLKKLSRSITAIVTVADDGGGSGMLREDLGMPPPGDVRNCLQALANTEPIMEQLLAYRFTEGSLKGQSFGNLFLAALNGMSDTFRRGRAPHVGRPGHHRARPARDQRERLPRCGLRRRQRGRGRDRA